VARFGRSVPMVHSDMGTGDAASNARLSAFISGQLPRLLTAGGVVVSDQELAFAGAEALPLPAGVRSGRYFLYRMN
jgi:hypothetical protein